MKAILFITIFAFGSILITSRAEALSPPACVYEQNCSEKEYCSWSNTSRNWPNDTGYREDCSNLSDERPGNFNFALFGGAITVTALTIWGVLRFIRRTRVSKKI